MARANALDARSLSALVHHRQDVESINVRHIIHQLKGVVSDQEIETLSLDSTTNHQKVQCLVDILSNGSQEQFDRFVAILRAHVGEELANSLGTYQLQADKQQWSDAIVHDVLRTGKVDFFDKVVARPEKLELIRRQLRNVRSRQPRALRVVLVHGMGGSGKSVLASEAVRCAPLMAECLPHGILWKSAGHMRGLEGAELARAIEVLLREILSRPQLGWKPRHEQCQPEKMTLDQLDTEIINAVSNKQLLLVLDDVWQPDVLAAFIKVPILVLATSRSRAIADRLSAHIEYVEAMKCTEQEARGIVTSHCERVDEEALQALLKRCDGLPLALAIMASVLKDKPPPKQREITSTPSNAEWLTGEFHVLPRGYECLADALEASIRELEAEIKEKTRMGTLTMLAGSKLINLYLDIAALDDDEELFASKLVPVWNQSPDLTHRLLEVLAERNLLTRTGRKRAGTEEDVFTIHDVQLDFLRALVRSQEGDSLHGRYKRWIGGFLRKNELSGLLAGWEKSKELLCLDELWRIVRASEKGSDYGTEWWQRCLKPIASLLEQQVPLSPVEKEVFKTLLSRVTPSDRGWTIVHQASYEGRCTAIPALLRAFPRLHVRVTTTRHVFFDSHMLPPGVAPLHVASGRQAADCLIREHGCDPKEKMEDGTTVLIVAAMMGHKDVVDQLIREHGCDPKEKRHDGSTPLIAAARWGRKDVVDQLIRAHGCDPKEKSHDGTTPLSMAARRGQWDVVDQLIREHGCDPKEKMEDGTTVLIMAAGSGRKDVVDQLIREHGCDPKEKSHDGTTPLRMAAMMGHKDVVELLIREHGCGPAEGGIAGAAV